MNRIRENWYLTFPISAMLVITIVRLYFSLVTGYLSPDEAFYFSSGIISYENNVIVWRYQNRFIFQYFIMKIVSLFKITNVYTYITSMTILFSMGSMSNFLMLNNLSKKLKVDEESRKWIIASYGLCVTFVLYSAMILTEVFSLFFYLFGLILMYKMLEEDSSLYALFSGLFIMISATERTPYIVYYGMNLLIVMYETYRKRIRGRNLILFGSALILGFLLMSYLPGRIEPAIQISEVVTKFTGTENVSRSTTSMTYGRDTSKIMDLDLFRWSYRFVTNAISSLVLGWNPIFFIAVGISMYDWIKDVYHGDRSDYIMLLNVIMGFVSLGGVWAVFSRIPFFVTITSDFKLGAGLSVGIRFAHGSVISLLALSRFRFSVKKLFIVTFVILMFLFPTYLFSIQTNLSVENINRISPSYVSPWLMLRRNTENSGNVLVLGDPILRTAIFAYDLDNVVISHALKESDFGIEYNNSRWNRILIYGEKHQLHISLLELNCPWHIELLNGRTKYEYEVVWENAESYCYEII